MRLKDILVYERKSWNLTQKELAKEICVSIQTINNWENGKTLPDTANLLRLTDYFDVDFLGLHKYKNNEKNISNKVISSPIISSIKKILNRG